MTWFLILCSFIGADFSVPHQPGLQKIAVCPPAGAVKHNLRLDIPHKSVVFSRHSDGSVRHAIVFCRPSKKQTEAESNSLPIGQANGPRSYSIRFNVGGIDYGLSPAQADLHPDPGEFVSLRRLKLRPQDSAGNPHPHLWLILDVEAYDREAFVRATVHNSFDAPATPARLTYVATIERAGFPPTVLDFTASPTGRPHTWCTGWTLRLSLGDYPEPVINPHWDTLLGNGLPRFSDLVSTEHHKTLVEDFNWLPLGRGDKHAGLANMLDHGGAYRMAFQPRWVAVWTKARDEVRWQWVRRMAELSLSWPMHLLEPDGSIPSIDLRPGLWLDGRNRGRPNGGMRLNFTYAGSPQIAADLQAIGFPKQADTNHAPDLCTAAALASGELIFFDEMEAWANFALLNADPQPSQRNGSQGLLRGFEIRGEGYGGRNLAHAAALLPDFYPSKSYFHQKYVNNVAEWDQRGINTFGPLRVPDAPLSQAGESKGYYTVKPWQWATITHAIDEGHRLGLTQGGQDWLAAVDNFAVNMATNPDWNGAFPEADRWKYWSLYMLCCAKGHAELIPGTSTWKIVYDDWADSWAELHAMNAENWPGKTYGFFREDFLATANDYGACVEYLARSAVKRNPGAIPQAKLEEHAQKVSGANPGWFVIP